MAGALSVEQEEGTEDEGKRGSLQFASALVVGQIPAVCRSPATQRGPETGENVLANRLVDPLAHRDAKVTRLTQDRVEATLPEPLGCQQRDQRAMLLIECRSVKLEV